MHKGKASYLVSGAALRGMLFGFGVSVLVAAPAQAGFELISRTTIESVMPPNGSSGRVRDSSADGRLAVFHSTATNLVATDSNGDGSSVFLWDENTASLSLVSVRGDGSQPESGYARVPSISADGRYVAFLGQGDFETPGDSRLGIWVHDRVGGTTRLASVDAVGNPVSVYFEPSRISGDGGFVAFSGFDSDLNKVLVYRKNLTTGDLDVASLNDSSLPADLSFSYPFDVNIADDGSRAAFITEGAVLAADSDADTDIYVHDFASGTTLLASRDGAGAAGPGVAAVPDNGRWLSGDGSRLLFSSNQALTAADTRVDPAQPWDVYLAELDYISTPTWVSTTMVSTNASGLQALGPSVAASLSRDGGHAAFFTSASPISQNNFGFGPNWSVVLKNLGSGATQLALVEQGSEQCCASFPFISADSVGDPGFHVADSLDRAFFSTFDDLAQDDFNLSGPFPFDLVVTDLSGSELIKWINAPDTSAANQRAAGNSPSRSEVAVVSENGQVVLFESYASNFGILDFNRSKDLYVRDRGADTMQKVAAGNASCTFGGDMTPDGRYVVYNSCDDETGEGALGQQVYRWDRLTDQRTLVSRADGASGAVADSNSFYPRISDDGNRVLFISFAGNLDALGGGSRELFIRDVALDTVTRVTLPGDVVIPGAKDDPVISGDGSHVGFNSSEMLLPADTNGFTDAYWIDTATGSLQFVGLVGNGSEYEGSRIRSILPGGRKLHVEAYVEITGPMPDTTRHFLRDLDSGVLTRMDVRNNLSPLGIISSGFARPIGAVSDSGTFAVFSAHTEEFQSGEGLVDYEIYVRDLVNQVTLRLTVLDGQPLEGDAEYPQISADGRWIIFQSNSVQIPAPPNNGGIHDVFFIENPLYLGEIVSDVDTLTPQVNLASVEPAVSSDGQFVVFESEDPDHVNCYLDAGGNEVFLADIPLEEREPYLDTNGLSDVFRINSETGCVLRVSVGSGTLGSKQQATGASGQASISANGLLVVFSAPEESIPLLLNETPKTSARRIKVGLCGGPAVFLRNLLTGTTQQVGCGTNSGSGALPQISADGSAIVYGTDNPAEDPTAGDSNGMPDVVRALIKPALPGGFERLCVSCKGRGLNNEPLDTPSNGASGEPVVSADGTWVGFSTTATNLSSKPGLCDPGPSNATIMLRNLLTGQVLRPSTPQATPCVSGSSSRPKLDLSGNRMVFQSAQPLVPGDSNPDTDAYLFDLATQRLQQVSVRSNGQPVSGSSGEPTISGDGNIIAFTTTATDFNPDQPDANGAVRDVVVRDVRRSLVRRLARNPNGVESNGDSRRPAMNYKGDRILFQSSATNLQSTVDANGTVEDVYLRINPVTIGGIFNAGFE